MKEHTRPRSSRQPSSNCPRMLVERNWRLRVLIGSLLSQPRQPSSDYTLRKFLDPTNPLPIPCVLKQKMPIGSGTFGGSYSWTGWCLLTRLLPALRQPIPRLEAES